MAGRKPIPTNLKLIRGTARPHRLNPDEPMPTLGTPPPPPHLDDRARGKFVDMAQMLARCGVMTLLDGDALARYCVVWGRWIDAEAEVRRKGRSSGPRAATSSTVPISPSPIAATASWRSWKPSSG